MIETDRASLEPTEEQVVYETGPNRLDRDSLDSVPEGTGKKLYTIGCYTKEDWEHVHEVLMQDGTLEDNIPPSSIECADEKAIVILEELISSMMKNGRTQRSSKSRILPR